MTDLNWLQRCCSLDKKSQLREPLSATINGEKWAVGMDGYHLAAVKGENGFKEAEKSFQGKLETILDLSDIKAAPILSMETVKSFAKEGLECKLCNNTGHIKCPECNGTGRAERRCEHCDEWHDCVCDECVEGIASCPRCGELKYAWIGEALINKRFLFDIVADLKGERISILTNGDYKPIKLMELGGDGTLAIIMPIRSLSHELDKEQKEAPRLEMEAPC